MSVESIEMKIARTTGWVLVAAGVCCAVAHAQSYPTKPVRFVVGFPAGGATDVVARTISQKLGESLGQPVLVDNRAGAASNIGAELVATSPRTVTPFSWAPFRHRSIRASTKSCPTIHSGISPP